MTLLHMNDYEFIAIYSLRCRLCHHEFETFDRDSECRCCDGPTEVYGIEEQLVNKKHPEAV